MATAQTARLRVGPGLNRTSVAFLEPRIDFTALGRFTADDGSVWYQLDPALAAPGRSMAEAWVLADEVDASGDCDAVADAAAPPIIPIVQSPPTAPPGDDTTGQPAPTAAAGEIIPLSGQWTLTFDPLTYISCVWSGTEPRVSRDIYGDLVFYGPLTVLDGGARFRFYDDIYTRRPGNRYGGTYTGGDADPNILNAQMRFVVVSPTLMSGEMVVNMRVNEYGYSGYTCSYTTRLTLVRTG